MHIFILLLYNMNNENNERVAGLDRGCRRKLCEENFDHREKLVKFKSTTRQVLGRPVCNQGAIP